MMVGDESIRRSAVDGRSRMSLVGQAPPCRKRSGSPRPTREAPQAVSFPLTRPAALPSRPSASAHCPTVDITTMTRSELRRDRHGPAGQLAVRRDDPELLRSVFVARRSRDPHTSGRSEVTVCQSPGMHRHGDVPHLHIRPTAAESFIAWDERIFRHLAPTRAHEGDRQAFLR
jgi:hypothetical protein